MGRILPPVVAVQTTIQWVYNATGKPKRFTLPLSWNATGLPLEGDARGPNLEQETTLFQVSSQLGSGCTRERHLASAGFRLDPSDALTLSPGATCSFLHQAQARSGHIRDQEDDFVLTTARDRVSTYQWGSYQIGISLLLDFVGQRSVVPLTTLAQLSHQTKKYDLKSKHCGAQSDLGTTRAKVVEALTEMRRAKIDGPALIFDDQLCELHSSNTDASTSASSRSMPNVLGKGSDFSTTNRHWPRNPAVFWGIPGVGCVTVGKFGLGPQVEASCARKVQGAGECVAA